MFGVGEAFDRKAVRGEGRGSDRRDTGEGDQDLTVGVGQQFHDLTVNGGDVTAQTPISVKVAGQPMSTLFGVSRRG